MNIQPTERDYKQAMIELCKELPRMATDKEIDDRAFAIANWIPLI